MTNQEMQNDAKQKLEQFISDIITRHKRTNGDAEQFRRDLIDFQNRVVKNCSLAVHNEEHNNTVCDCSSYLLSK